MSIYASIFGFDADEHAEGCKRLVKRRRDPKRMLNCFMFPSGTFWVDDSRPCTCSSGPIAYQHSGVLPSASDKRGGYLGIAAIPGHIDDSNRKPISDDMQPYWPWLRVSLDGVNDSTVILTRKQVTELRDALNEWLKLAVKNV